jgi:transcriptional regulator with XRE-family HTH domain
MTAVRLRKTKAESAATTASPEPVVADRNSNLGALVGQNINRLRMRRNLSLDALAKLSGVSRAMLGQIELGRSVPTINIVWKIANAFDVPFSTLITSVDVERMRMVSASQTKTLTSASGKFSSRALFPYNGERRTEFYEIKLKAGSQESAEAHAVGTMENLVVVHGVIEITMEGETKRLQPGDAVLFQADKPHVYHNTSKEDALAYLVMTYVEPGH